jgi:hypothetical protein
VIPHTPSSMVGSLPAFARLPGAANAATAPVQARLASMLSQDQLWASLADRVSSANRPETLRDVTAGSCQAKRPGTNRAGLARAKSSTPITPGHSHVAVDDAVHSLAILS